MPRTIHKLLRDPAYADQTAAVGLHGLLSQSFNFGGMPRMELELESVRGASTQERLKQADAVIAWLAAC